MDIGEREMDFRVAQLEFFCSFRGVLNLFWGRWWSCAVGIRKYGHWDVDWPYWYFLGLSFKKEITSQGCIRFHTLKTFEVMLWLVHCSLSSWSWGLAFSVRHFLPSCLVWGHLWPLTSLWNGHLKCMDVSSRKLKALCFMETRDPILQACTRLIFSECK